MRALDKALHLAIKYFSFVIPISSLRKKFRRKASDIIGTHKRSPSFLEGILLRGNPITLDTTLTAQKYEYAIGITTYSKRFTRFLKPLIAQIREHSNAPIIISINGDYNSKFDEKYRREILAFLAQYDDIYPSIHPQFRSLAKLWNEILVKSPLENVLLCNDDIALSKQFFDELDCAITQNKGKSFKMNTTWSHIFLNRNEVREIGWFDERFLNIGHEDIDFEVRWFHKHKSYFPNIIGVKGVKNFVDDKEVLVGQRIANSKYGAFNAEFFHKKYNNRRYFKDESQYPYEPFYWEHKNEL